MRKVADLARTYDHLVPWLLLAVIVGATLAVLQVLVVKLLH